MPSPKSSASVPLRRLTRTLYAALVVTPAVMAMAVGALAAVASADWYDTLLVPSFDPPAWLSAMGWSVADLMMAYAAYRVLCRPDWMPDRPRAVKAFMVEAGLVIAWPLAFFTARSPTAGLVVILALLAAAVFTGPLAAAVDRKAGLLVMLCGAWIGFAAVLCLSIFLRN